MGDILMGRIVGICEACGCNNNIEPGQRYFKCSACDSTNDTYAPDKTVRIENVSDVSQRNEVAMLLYKAGKYDSARNEWVQVIRVSPADGMAHLGIYLCEYAWKHKVLQSYIENGHPVIEKIRAGFSRSDGIAERNLPELVIKRDSADYFLAEQYAPKSEFSKLDKDITLHNEYSNLVEEACNTEFKKWVAEVVRKQEAERAERTRREKNGLCLLCGGKLRKDKTSTVTRICKKCGAVMYRSNYPER